jgi:hypothetical protein
MEMLKDVETIYTKPMPKIPVQKVSFKTTAGGIVIVSQGKRETTVRFKDTDKEIVRSFVDTEIDEFIGILKTFSNQLKEEVTT